MCPSALGPVSSPHEKHSNWAALLPLAYPGGSRVDKNLVVSKPVRIASARNQHMEWPESFRSSHQYGDRKISYVTQSHVIVALTHTTT